MADDEKLEEVARNFRKKAAESLKSELNLEPSEKLQLLDVARRSRNWHGAERLCDELLAETLEEPMNEVAAFQRELIRNEDDRRYRVIDAIENTAN